MSTLYLKEYLLSKWRLGQVHLCFYCTCNPMLQYLGKSFQQYWNIIFQVCVAISSSQKTIQTTIETNHKEHLSTAELRYTCKPMWEDGGFRIGLNRKEAGTWQTRITLTGKQILVNFAIFELINL